MREAISGYYLHSDGGFQLEEVESCSTGASNDGAGAEDWLAYASDAYYYFRSAAAVKGWQKIGGYWYY